MIHTTTDRLCLSAAVSGLCLVSQSETDTCLNENPVMPIDLKGGEPPCRASPSGRPDRISVQIGLSEGHESLAVRDLGRALCLECVSGGR